MTLRKPLMIVLIALLLGSCTRVGPDMVHKDRFDYTTAVGESWKEQVLLNIVRVRYGDWPSFVTVDQIVTAYTMEHSGTAKLSMRRWWADTLTNDQLEAGWVGKFAERPTILYTPLSGKKYVNSLLTPAQPASILALMETGWPADHLGRIAIRSVNEHYNTSAEYDVMHRTDVVFAQFITMLKALQSAEAMKIGIKKPMDKPETIVLTLYPARLSGELRLELHKLKEDLGLDVTKNVYRIVRNATVEDPGEIRIQGRSVLQVLVAMAMGVEIPDEHVRSSTAPPLKPIPEEEVIALPPLLVVNSGPERPKAAYVKVRYQNMWFWIDSTDHFSKRSLTYTLALITLLDSEEKAGGSVVIPIN